MITGIHAIVFSPEAEQVRAFFRDVLGLSSVDAGGGWLIFALPPAEFAVHPTEHTPRYELYLMCDDINATTKALQAKGVEFAYPVKAERWGLVTAITVPGGGEMGLYEPRHPTALNINR